MASFVKKTMLYLGLGSDEDFQTLDQGAPAAPVQDEIYLEGAEPRVLAQPVGVTVGGGEPPRGPRGLVGGPAEQGSQQSAVRMLAADEAPSSTERATPSLVRTLPPTSKISPEVVAPASFDDAQMVADSFKQGRPVVMNLQSVSTDLSRRLMDFTSGLCYGMGGRMKKVGHRVYLLTPDEVDVSAEDRNRLRDAGLHD